VTSGSYWFKRALKEFVSAGDLQAREGMRRFRIEAAYRCAGKEKAADESISAHYPGV
jgi:hypothetical protein